MRLFNGDCRELILAIAHEAVNIAAIVTDPPYEIGIAGQSWDSTGVAHDPETWRAFWELLADGGYILAFGATRNHHHLALALEQAGYEIQDEIPWLYAQGYPKGKGLLKPANEPIIVARKGGTAHLRTEEVNAIGDRWPANVTVDEHAWEWLKEKSGAPPFAFVAKPSPGERQLGVAGGYHETVKPLKLMRWLVSLVSEPGDVILDPFMGSGSTIAAALIEGRDAIGVELGADNYRNAIVRIADLVMPYGIRINADVPARGAADGNQ